MEIRKDIYEQMIQDAIESFPNECCGILAGKTNTASKIYPVKNVEVSPETGYLMDSDVQFKILKILEQSSIEVIAFYHSHPNSECYPSKKDIDLISYPDSLYVIISLAEIESPEVKAFKIQKDKVREEEIKII
ncbi:M67 family metallopeptidase [Candidatus Desantisbacteria bacterium]|nr:M67 family metallopeptidase [Candidatus Desantisbacteria bacterium]